MSKTGFGRGITSFLSLNIVMLVVAVMVFTTMMDLRREREAFAKRHELQGLALAESLGKAIPRPLLDEDVVALRNLAAVAGSQEGLSYIRIFSADGDALISAGDDESLGSAKKLDLRTVQRGEIVHELDGDVLAFVAPVESDGELIGGVQFGYGSDGLAVRNATIIVERVWQTLLLIVAGLVVAYLLGQYFVRPLRHLSKATRQMADGDFKSKVVTNRSDEIGALSLAISAISDKLQGRAVGSVGASSNSEIFALQKQLEKEISKRRSVEDALNDADQAILDERLERTQLEQQLKQIQNKPGGDDPLESQVRSIVHDINNLLMPIKGHTEMAKRRLLKGDPIHTNLDEIQNASDRISDLVERLRTYMKANTVGGGPQKPKIESVTVKPDSGEVLPLSEGDVILLVDDEPTVRGISALMLRDLGYKVLEADGGNEALQLVQAYPDTRIKLLLTDVVMPEMAGRELASKLQSEQPGTRVLFMSGFNLESLIEHGDLDKNANFMRKPVSIETLRGKMQEVFDLGLADAS